MREGSAWQKGARETESTLDTIYDRRDVSPIREGRILPFDTMTSAVELQQRGGNEQLSLAENIDERPYLLSNLCWLLVEKVGPIRSGSVEATG